jgi:hypothetical protein
MLISEIYKKLYDFTLRATGYAADKIIIANQSTPRPKKPFITISVGSFKNIGTPMIKHLDDQGLQEATVSMIFTASFQAFSDKMHEAEDILSTLYIKFATELQNDIFKGEMALQRTLKNVTAIPTALNEQIESRAMLDLEMGFNKSTTYQVGLVEAVVVTNLINNSQMTVNKEV